MADPADMGMPSPKARGSLTLAQRRMLGRICATNGGGIYVEGLDGNEQRVVMRLHALGLVQGKAGNLSRAVHTRDGLKLWRDLSPASSEDKSHGG